MNNFGPRPVLSRTALPALLALTLPLLACSSKNDDATGGGGGAGTTSAVTGTGGGTTASITVGSGGSCPANGTSCSDVSDCPLPTSECIEPVCNQGCCDFANLPKKTACNAMSGTVCDGNGYCVGCFATSDCGKPLSSCQTLTCDTGTNSCTESDKAKGSACSDNGGSVCNDKGACVSAQCNDGLMDGDETDKDCGGACAKQGGTCANTKACKLSTDCDSTFCDGTGHCAPVAAGGECSANSQCDSKICGATGTGHCCTELCSAANALCGITDCDDQGACVYPSGTSCGAESCTGKVLTGQACDGTGSCKSGTTDCPSGYLCADTKSCGTSCTDKNDCDTGYSCVGGACVGKIVFVTTNVSNGNLGGLSGADAKCAAEATSAKLEGTYKAWLSTSVTSASSRLSHATVSYNLADGTLVADSWTGLTSGTLKHAIDEDATGKAATGNAWTNTSADGTSTSLLNDCSGWASNSNLASGDLGQSSATSSSWTASGNSTCDQSHVLYCVEQ